MFTTDTVVTVEDRKKATMVFAYWLRTIASSGHMDYKYLAALVLKYYLIPFEWSAKLKNKCLALSKDGRTFHKINSKSMVSTLCSTNALNVETMTEVDWELTLRQKGSYPQGTMGGNFLYDGRNRRTDLKMGFMRLSLVNTDHGNERVQLGRASLEQDIFEGLCAVGDEDAGVAVHFVDGNYPVVIRNNAFSGSSVGGWKISAKDGDRFRLHFDLVMMQCSAFYNDHPLGLISDRVPEKMCLAATVCGLGASYETTMFDAKLVRNRRKEYL